MILRPLFGDKRPLRVVCANDSLSSTLERIGRCRMSVHHQLVKVNSGDFASELVIRRSCLTSLIEPDLDRTKGDRQFPRKKATRLPVQNTYGRLLTVVVQFRKCTLRWRVFNVQLDRRFPTSSDRYLKIIAKCQNTTKTTTLKVWLAPLLDDKHMFIYMDWYFSCQL